MMKYTQSLLCLTIFLATCHSSASEAEELSVIATKYLARFSTTNSDAKWEKNLNERATQAEIDSSESTQAFANRVIQDYFFAKRRGFKSIDEVPIADLVDACRYVLWAHRKELALPEKVREPLYQRGNIIALSKLVDELIASAK